jgi:hypothetical protein
LRRIKLAKLMGERCEADSLVKGRSASGVRMSRGGVKSFLAAVNFSRTSDPTSRKRSSRMRSGFLSRSSLKIWVPGNCY